MSTIYVAHVKAWNGSSEVTLYFSSGFYVTRGAIGIDPLPPNGVTHKWYDPRIQQPALMRRDCWSKGTTGGESTIGYGTLELSNADGGLDYLIDWGLDGRKIDLYVGEVTQGNAPVWTTILSGTMAPPEVTRSQVKLRLRDRQASIDKPVCPNTYAGTNALPNGLEGEAADIKGRRKPKTFGQVFNIEPICVNTSRLIYQVNDGAIVTVDAAYDQCAALTKGADYASQADMETTAPAAGNYRVWPAGGYFRLGSALAGLLTCDVTQGAAASNRTAAQIINTIATTSGGLTGADISSADITALDAAQNGVIGLYFDDETTCRNAIDSASNSVGAWWGFDRSGILRMKRFDAPSGSPVIVLTEGDTIKIDRMNTDDGGVPFWKVTLNYKRHFVTQTNDIAGGVTAARRAAIGQEWRSVNASDASVKTARLLAQDIAFYSHLIDATVAATECTRRLNLYKVQRHRYEVIAAIDAAAISLIDLGVVIQVKNTRFGMTAGKDFIVIGYKIDLRLNTADLTLWG